MTAWDVLTVAIPFVWLGMTGAISFIETPLKFRAPGVTLAVGLGIGRIMFRVMSGVDVVLLVVLSVLVATADIGSERVVWLLAVLAGTVVVQVLGVRPRLVHRSDAVIAGREVPGSRLHLLFIVLDLVKLVGLAALGTVLVRAVAP